MDASTLEFPRNALFARRPDGVIEYAILASEWKYRICWETIAGGERHSKTIHLTAADIEESGKSLDELIEEGRAEAIQYFQTFEAPAALAAQDHGQG